MPEINILPVHTARLPVMGIDAEFNPFNVEQEKALIAALEEDNPDDIVRNYEAILKSCIRTRLDWDRLTVIDYIALVISIRAKSKGEALALRKKECTECKNPFEFSVGIDQALRFTNEGNKKGIVRITDELSLEVSPLSYRFLYGLSGITDEMDLYVHTAAHAISKVFWGKDIYTPGPDELKEKVIRNLTRVNLEDIFRSYQDLVSMHLDIEYVCPSCGHKENQVVKDFLKSLK